MWIILRRTTICTLRCLLNFFKYPNFGDFESKIQPSKNAHCRAYRYFDLVPLRGEEVWVQSDYERSVPIEQTLIYALEYFCFQIIKMVLKTLENLGYIYFATKNTIINSKLVLCNKFHIAPLWSVYIWDYTFSDWLLPRYNHGDSFSDTQYFSNAGRY